MKHHILAILLYAMTIAGCTTMAVTDEPFFRSREMCDTLDAYLSRIDTSYTTAECPLVTFVIVHDMWENDSPVLFIKTTRMYEVWYPSASNGTSAFHTFLGMYHGHYLNLGFDSKYKRLFKRGLTQCELEKEEYLLNIRKRSIEEHSELIEGYAYYNIQSDGSLMRVMYEENIYNRK